MSSIFLFFVFFVENVFVHMIPGGHVLTWTYADARQTNVTSNFRDVISSFLFYFYSKFQH